METPYDLLIHGGTIVTVNSDFEIYEKGLLGIRNDRIALIESAPDSGRLPPASRVIDASGNLVLPGLVNTHTHLPMSLFRGLADDLPLQEWLHNHIFPTEARIIDAATVRIGTRLSCAELILNGTTTCCDGYFFETEVAETLFQTGLRAVLGQGIVDFPAPGVMDPKNNIGHARTFVNRWLNRCDRIHPSLFCHSPYTCSADTLQRAKSAAEENGLLFQIHVAETRQEVEQIRSEHKTTPIAYLNRMGLLDERTLLVHCVWLDPDDIRMIAQSGAHISHNPESNLKLAAGISPADSILKAGIRLGIGTDGSASNNSLDLFQTMDLCAKLHKVHTGDPTTMNARKILELATIDGAAAIGLDHEIGSLETGKKADIVIIDLMQPHLTPIYHPESHLVYTARGSDVQTVIIDGKPVLENKTLLTLDSEEVMAEANEVAMRIKQESGA